MAILFKTCPRCGGDIDATFRDDLYCVQCGHRPSVLFPLAATIAHAGPKLTMRAVHMGWETSAEMPGDVVTCPKCRFSQTLQLDILRPNDNVCYRCRICGHIFSPLVLTAEERPEEATR